MYKCFGGGGWVEPRGVTGEGGGHGDVQLTGEERPPPPFTSHQPHPEGESSGKTLACAQLYPLRVDHFLHFFPLQVLK